MNTENDDADFEEICKARLCEIADTLRSIRELQLYRESHSTFERYCRFKWKLPRKELTLVLMYGDNWICDSTGYELTLKDQRTSAALLSEIAWKNRPRKRKVERKTETEPSLPF